MRRPSCAKTNLAGGCCVHVRADRPALVVQVELRHHVHQVHVGFVVGVERPHIAPVAHASCRSCRGNRRRPRARCPELRGITSWPKSCVEFGSCGVLVQRPQQHVRVEDVDAHGGADHVGVERATAWGCRAAASPRSRRCGSRRRSPRRRSGRPPRAATWMVAMVTSAWCRRCHSSISW